jgi:hypothetical protein
MVVDWRMSFFFFLFFLAVFGEEPKRGITVNSLRYRQISTPFNGPVGIDYYAPLNNIILTANYFYGYPHNFQLVDFDGKQFPFSTAANLTDEIKLQL